MRNFKKERSTTSLFFVFQKAKRDHSTAIPLPTPASMINMSHMTHFFQRFFLLFLSLSIRFANTATRRLTLTKTFPSQTRQDKNSFSSPTPKLNRLAGTETSPDFPTSTPTPWTATVASSPTYRTQVYVRNRPAHGS
ncbi:MAG: hypothetical protein UY81_C0011G0014 [Candidatus Giovannonibacteria bacterium GW2011_GWA2_53_7]|uniref:Uncharacterized protein n=1 Tax=Candidatus Giovannonibacteria bacterium GW2011_GWA2_53_7 TaxID=1618650 RepID=A0A0G2AVE3_9BACT|nr:MAG: hypothetical protein UY81_C0011G0014 [Candidatus Giovannonibacteria bacterium GW2011_GWA2_53_7]